MVARNLLRKHVKLVLPFLPQKLRREFAYFKTRHDLDQPYWWGAISANLLSKSYNREVSRSDSSWVVGQKRPK
jgi:hypothetical protein